MGVSLKLLVTGEAIDLAGPSRKQMDSFDAFSTYEWQDEPSPPGKYVFAIMDNYQCTSFVWNITWV